MTELAPFTAAGRARFAAAARFERDQRAALYPARIAERRIGRWQAELDHAAWAAIADFLAGGRGFHLVDPLFGEPITLRAMEHAAQDALALGEEALARAEPGRTAEARARRDTLAAIHRILAANRALVDELNTALRRQVSSSGALRSAPEAGQERAFA